MPARVAPTPSTNDALTGTAAQGGPAARSAKPKPGGVSGWSRPKKACYLITAAVSLLTTLLLPLVVLGNVSYVVDVPQVLMDNAVQAIRLEAEETLEGPTCTQPLVDTWCDRYSGRVLGACAMARSMPSAQGDVSPRRVFAQFPKRASSSGAARQTGLRCPPSSASLTIEARPSSCSCMRAQVSSLMMPSTARPLREALTLAS